MLYGFVKYLKLCIDDIVCREWDRCASFTEQRSDVVLYGKTVLGRLRKKEDRVIELSKNSEKRDT